MTTIKEALGTETDDILAPFLRVITQSYFTRLNGHLAMIYMVGSAQMMQWAGVPYEGPPMAAAIKYASERAGWLIKNMNQETISRLKTVISDGILNKRGVPGITSDLRHTFTDMSKGRAQTIARTETNDALSQAFLDRAEEMNIEGKEWVASDPCPICAGNEGDGVIPIDDSFSSGHDRPPAHPNCLLPDVRIEAPLTIAGSRAFYNGKAIEIATERGHKLTITPNHMILTPRGFMRAKSLHEGDHIISCLDSQRIASSIDPNYDYSPALIEDIWNSLVVQKGMVLAHMKTAAKDFYGDAGGFDGNIDIISPDSFLVSDIVNTFGFQHIGKYYFYCRNVEPFDFSGLGSLPPLGYRDTATPYGFMGVMSQGRAFGGGEPVHSDNVGLATIPRGDARFEQTPSDCAPTYTKLARQFQFRFSSLIAPDKLVKVRDFNYSGHVYDLQSLEQLYIGNNIVVKNCRCALAPARLSR